MKKKLHKNQASGIMLQNKCYNSFTLTLGVWVRTCKCITRSSGQKPFGLSIKMKLSLRKRAKPFLFLFQEELKKWVNSDISLVKAEIRTMLFISTYVSFFNLFQNPFHLFSYNNYCCLCSDLSNDSIKV